MKIGTFMIRKLCWSILLPLAVLCFLSTNLFHWLEVVKAEDLKVIHSEAPEYPAIARTARVIGQATIQVAISPGGQVVNVTVLDGHALLQRTAEMAAWKWVFNPVEGAEIRQINLVFNFDGVTVGDDDDTVQVTYDDQFTVRLLYKLGTIHRLELENGKIPEKTCELHGEVMKNEVVEIGNSLPACYYEGDKKACKRLKEYLTAMLKYFPETNRAVGGGCCRDHTTRWEVYYCDSCRKAEKEWFLRHRETQVSPFN